METRKGRGRAFEISVGNTEKPEIYIRRNVTRVTTVTRTRRLGPTNSTISVIRRRHLRTVAVIIRWETFSSKRVYHVQERFGRNTNVVSYVFASNEFSA